MELNENIVGNLSSLFNVDKDVVTKALTETDADGSFIESFKETNVIKSKTDFETFQNNLVQETKNNHILELKEKAKNKDLPQELYSFFKGNVTEELERKLSKAAGITEFENYEDLVNKVIASKGTDETVKQQLKELQERNQSLQTEKDSALSEAQKRFNDQLINFDKSTVFNSIKLDYEDEAKPKQLQLLKSQVDSNFKYIRENDKTIVTDLQGNVLKDPNTLEPLTLKDVVLNVAKDYDFKLKSPESGGQGGSSSQGNNSANGISWDDYLKANNTEPYTSAADKLRVEWKKQNK